jgi:hypothetical protein
MDEDGTHEVVRSSVFQTKLTMGLMVVLQHLSQQIYQDYPIHGCSWIWYESVRADGWEEDSCDHTAALVKNLGHTPEP